MRCASIAYPERTAARSPPTLLSTPSSMTVNRFASNAPVAARRLSSIGILYGVPRLLRYRIHRRQNLILFKLLQNHLEKTKRRK
ncbi:MAG: hypothetical protein DBY40_02880 [Clostridiales bacterium]|nr:MAG: hypothetical protein DBY40_02880 [Clostridiales bacterium]